MTPAALRVWLDNAAHGASVTYHTGISATGKTCALAMDLSDLGEIALVQRRLGETGEGRFAYIAQRIRRERRR